MPNASLRSRRRRHSSVYDDRRVVDATLGIFSYLAALKQCHQTVHEMGAPRISTPIRLCTRTDRLESIAGKVRSVEDRLAE